MFRRFSPWRLVGWFLRLIFTGLILFVIGFLACRVISLNHDPKAMTTLTCDASVAQAYREHGRDMVFYSQPQGTYTRAESNAGYFYVKHAVMIPQAHEIQFVFRYNESTVRHLTEDYGVPAEQLPDGTEEVYDLSLVVKRSLTPNVIPEDGDEEGTYELIRYYPAEVISYQRNAYHYRRVVFRDVDIQPDTLGVFVDIYYTGAVDYEKAAYGTLRLWDCTSVDKPYKLSGADRKALKAAVLRQETGSPE